MSPDLKTLEKDANRAARQYMGGFAWLTAMFGAVIFLSYAATIYLFVTGELSLLWSFVALTVLTYCSYTVLHDTVHGSLNGQHKNLSWVNDAYGYLAGQIMFVSYRAHRREHLAHHRETNKPTDPDMFLPDDSLWSLIRGTLVVLPIQYIYFFRDFGSTAKRSEKFVVILELLCMFGWRLALVFAGFWQLGIVLMAALFCAVFALVILFVWLVHRPHDETRRYKNTNTIVLPGWLNRPVTWLWLYQNYHSIHHLFPRVPFYLYRRLYDDIESIMVANDAPIIRWGHTPH